MKTKFFTITAIVLLLVGSFFSCNNKNNIDKSIDYSNIENLYEQPLPVIQKCVQGKWKWVEISRWGFIGFIKPDNTFVEIKENKVVITQIDGEPWADMDIYMKSFSYEWIKMETLGDYTTYVMWDNEHNRGKWNFKKIQNDTLYVVNDDTDPNFKTSESYIFVKVNK